MPGGKMTLSHKIKLVFARINWWLRITEKSRKHYEALKDYYYYYNLHNIIPGAYLESEKRSKMGEETLKLKGQVELLKEILDIKQ